MHIFGLHASLGGILTTPRVVSGETLIIGLSAVYPFDWLRKGVDRSWDFSLRLFYAWYVGLVENGKPNLNLLYRSTSHSEVGYWIIIPPCMQTLICGPSVSSTYFIDF